MTFSLRPRRGRSLLPFPLPPAGGSLVPAVADFFLLLLFLFCVGGASMSNGFRGTVSEYQALYMEKNAHLEQFLEQVTPF